MRNAAGAPAVSRTASAFLPAPVATADSLPALQAALADAFGDLPVDDLVKVMEIGFAAAELAGRVDVAADN